jgi:allantoinase
MTRVLRSRTIVTRASVLDGAVAIEGEKIAAILSANEVPRDAVDLGDAAILPGVVDSHAHLNEPGRTEWEGFDTATRAAAAGGVTTIVDMPLNCIPVTTSLAALREKRAAVADHAHVDYAFWGGVVPGNDGELAAMIEDGIAGAKAFLCHSGIDDFPASTEKDLRLAMPVLAKAKRPLLLHAEIESGATAHDHAARDYATYLASRPSSWEVDAVRLCARLCAEFRGPVHIVHLSAADALREGEAAQKRGLPFSFETCPHYLVLAAEEIADGHTEFKCAPPIRDKANRERLWEALRRGEISLVVSDHSPCTPQLKKMDSGDFLSAWGGIASLQFGLSLIWTDAKKRGFALADLARWMSAAPAKLAGIADRKGAIAVGYDADLVVFDPTTRFTVQPEIIHFRHKLTPYMGRTLDGVVRETILRGTTVYRNGTFPTSARGRETRPRGDA